MFMFLSDSSNGQVNEPGSGGSEECTGLGQSRRTGSNLI